MRASQRCSMIPRVKNVLLIGLDGAMYYFVKKFAEEGFLPHMRKMMEEGVSGEALPSLPCDTPTNWTTIATGASTAAHGVASFYIHIPGEPFELGQKLRSRGQLTKYCKAEYLWKTADKLGIPSLVLNYPAGWPGGMKNGYVSLYSWPMPESIPRILAGQEVQILEHGSHVNLQVFSKVIPSLKFRLEIKSTLLEDPVNVDVYSCNLEGSGYKLILPRNDQYEVVNKGEWSNWITAKLRIRPNKNEYDVQTYGGVVKGLFKLKLLESSEKYLKILRSEIFTAEGWTDPRGLEEEVVKSTHYTEEETGLYKSDDRKLVYDITGEEVEYLSRQRIEAHRLARIASYFKQRIGWRLSFLHYHLMDGVNHRFLGYLYRKFPFYDEKKAEQIWKYFAEAYKILDEFVGLVLDSCSTPETLVIVVSDHAALPAWKTVNIRKVFVDEGLLHYKSTPDGYLVDWSKTRAFPWVEPLAVWINLQGRDPQGIVRNEEYESIRSQVVEILQNLKDPDTGDRITTMVMTKEESVNVGLGDERTGDVVYALRPSYTIWWGPIEDLLTYKATDRHLNQEWLVESQSNITGIHGYYLPNDKVGEFSNSSMLIIKGPGIKKGEELKKQVRLMDIAPTISYMLGINPPHTSEGRVLYEILS